MIYILYNYGNITIYYFYEININEYVNMKYVIKWN